MISSGHVALDGSLLKLVTETPVLVISSDGKFLVTEKNTGRVETLLKKSLDRRI